MDRSEANSTGGKQIGSLSPSFFHLKSEVETTFRNVAEFSCYNLDDGRIKKNKQFYG
jgi:hypothetical protein